MTDFPDITRLLATYLRPIMAPLPVVTTVPHPRRPDEFVQVRRVGGVPRRPIVDAGRMDVLCWAETEERAHELGTTARAALYALQGQVLDGVVVYQVIESAGPVIGADAATGRPRCRLTALVHVRAEGVIHR